MSLSSNALCAKAKAMYGGRLNKNVYLDLTRKQTIGEVVSYLKSQTSYADALKDINIRIGNDISVQWAITHNGTPESLEARKLNLQLSCMYGKYDITDYTIVGNTIRFTFYGKDQKSCGNYTLTLFENKGEKGMMD